MEGGCTEQWQCPVYRKVSALEPFQSVWQMAETSYTTHCSWGSVLYYLVLLCNLVFSTVWQDVWINSECRIHITLLKIHTATWQQLEMSSWYGRWKHLMASSLDCSHTTSWWWLPVQLVKFTLTIPYCSSLLPPLWPLFKFGEPGQETNHASLGDGKGSVRKSNLSHRLEPVLHAAVF